MIFHDISVSILGSIFGCIFNGNGSKMTSKIDPWSDIFDQKGSKSRVDRTPGTLLEPTFFGHRFLDAFWSLFGSILGPFGSFWALLALFGAENGPATHFYRFSKIWWIWGRFWFICLTANPQTNKTTNPQTTKPTNPPTNKFGLAECALALWIKYV